MAALRAHTVLSTGPAGQACCGVLTPCLACGLTLCPTPPPSSAGHRAASSSSSLDLRRMIHSLRCSLGWLLPLSRPAHLPPQHCLGYTTEEMAEGGHFSMLGETIFSFTGSRGRPEVKPSRLSRARCCQPRQLLGGTGGRWATLCTWLRVPTLSFQSCLCGCGAWSLWSIPEAWGLPQNIAPFCERAPCSTSKLRGKSQIGP